MVEVSEIRGASIIGKPGGWSVLLKLGMHEVPLGAQRSDMPRTWRSLDSCVNYLVRELHIVRFELLDATHFSEVAPEAMSRKDASERLRNVHEAAAHDKWFREQVEIGLAEADEPGTEWVTNEEANASWSANRAELLKRAEGSAA